jgi:response regulator RpfG family c-di-GMP phosphodiesterase
LKGKSEMAKILVIDDEPPMRGLIKARLQNSHEIIDTGDPEQAFALALENKPDLILLDLMMPKFSGFELCQSLHGLSYTSHIPIFVVTGESATKFREHCTLLGAKAYFEKPVDFAALKNAINEELGKKFVERRAHLRVRMKVSLRLSGPDSNGAPIEEITVTENISAGGFFCPCKNALRTGAVMEVYLHGSSDVMAGRAKVVRKETSDSPWAHYGFQFVETNAEWLLH